MFDVSHLGTVECRGPGAFELLQWLLTNDLRKIEPGRAQYTHLLDPDRRARRRRHHRVVGRRRSVLRDAERVEHRRDAGRVRRRASTHTDGEVEFADITPTRAVLAVQGPEARALLATVEPRGRRRSRGSRSRRVGDLVVAGTGYTGEDGVEIHVAAADAPALWDALVGAGIEPAGLGARDTLRLEAGLPLHGHELGAGHHAAAGRARLGRRLGQGATSGAARRSTAERERGIARRLRGLSVEGRRPPREGSAVLRDGADDRRRSRAATSRRCSATASRSRSCRRTSQPGDALQVDVRGQLLDAEVVPLPFVKK